MSAQPPTDLEVQNSRSSADPDPRRGDPWAPPWLLILSSVLVMGVAVLDFGPWLRIDDSLDANLTLFLGVAFVIAHGWAALGGRNLIVLILFTVGISFAAEAIGVATGLVFGRYYYTDLLGPKILGVPPMIQAGYLATGYASLLTGRVILGMTGPARGWAVLAVSLVGAFLMVNWDVAMDPFQSTVGGYWIWPDGGPYFGVGFHNYIGWFVTVFVFMFGYQWYASRSKERVRTGPAGRKYFWSQPVLYYAATALSLIVPPVVGGVSQPYASPTNYTGSVEQLTQSLMIVAIFVMGTPVVIALARILLDRPLPGSQGAEGG